MAQVTLHRDTVDRVIVKALKEPLYVLRKSLRHVEWHVAGNCQEPVFRELYARADGFTRQRVVRTATQGPAWAELWTRCRRCDTCRAHRAAVWTRRAYAELELAPRTWFITLTVNPEWRTRWLAQARQAVRFNGCDYDQLPLDEQFRQLCSVANAELTKWLKRVRKESRTSFRYLLVCERHKDGAPHWHMLLHERLGFSPVLWKHMAHQWTCGWSKINLVRTRGAASYVSKYISKSAVTRVRASARYGSLELPLALLTSREVREANDLPRQNDYAAGAGVPRGLHTGTGLTNVDNSLPDKLRVESFREQSGKRGPQQLSKRRAAVARLSNTTTDLAGSQERGAGNAAWAPVGEPIRSTVKRRQPASKRPRPVLIGGESCRAESTEPGVPRARQKRGDRNAASALTDPQRDTEIHPGTEHSVPGVGSVAHHPVGRELEQRPAPGLGHPAGLRRAAAQGPLPGRVERMAMPERALVQRPAGKLGVDEFQLRKRPIPGMAGGFHGLQPPERKSGVERSYILDWAQGSDHRPAASSGRYTAAPVADRGTEDTAVEGPRCCLARSFSGSCACPKAPDTDSCTETYPPADEPGTSCTQAGTTCASCSSLEYKAATIRAWATAVRTASASAGYDAPAALRASADYGPETAGCPMVASFAWRRTDPGSYAYALANSPRAKRHAARLGAWDPYAPSAATRRAQQNTKTRARAAEAWNEGEQRFSALIASQTTSRVGD